MNEFDNFTQPVREMTQEEKALKRCEQHLTDLRKMESIDFAFGGLEKYEALREEQLFEKINSVSMREIIEDKPKLSEIDRKIQTQIYLQNVRATLKMNMEVEDLAKRICEMSKAYEECVR